MVSGNRDLQQKKQELCRHEAGKETLIGAAHAIETACWDKIHEMLGQDSQLKEKNKKSRSKKTINSFARLIIEFKKEILQLPTYKNCNVKLLQVPLMERKELRTALQQPGGTPPGNRSILNFFR